MVYRASRLLAASIVVLSLVGRPARAQDRPPSPGELAPDRPGFTLSTNVVGAGVWEVESGVTVEGDGAGEGRVRALTTPQVLLRLGLGERAELRFGAVGMVNERLGVGPAARSHTGAGDIELGAKLRLGFAEAVGVDLAVAPAISFPTGSQGVSSGHVDAGVNLAWAHDLPRGFALGGSMGAASRGDDAGRFAQRSLGLLVARDLAAGFGGFCEVYGLSRLERGGNAAWTVDAGVTHGVGPNLQVDVSMGRGLSAAAPDWFLSAGVALRRLQGR